MYLPISLCRLNRYYFYTPNQKRLFVDILEGELIRKTRKYGQGGGGKDTIDARVEKIDTALYAMSSNDTGIGNGFLFGEKRIVKKKKRVQN